MYSFYHILVIYALKGLLQIKNTIPVFLFFPLSHEISCVLEFKEQVQCVFFFLRNPLILATLNVLQ